MSSIKLSPNASGTGIFSIEAPNSNTDRTLTLPDATGTFNISGAVNEVPAGSASAPSIYPTGDTNTGIFFPAADTIAWTTGGSERGRFTSGGYFKASFDGSYEGSTGTYHEFTGTTANGYTMRVRCTNASPASHYISDFRFTAASPNNTSAFFIECRDSTAARMEFRSNGGIANYSANNVNLSDRREKTNFAPAGSYLPKICAIPVQTFNYIDQNLEEDPGETLGVVAQDVQVVAPELVMESNWGTAEEPKMRLSIYQTDLQYALMKCIQELNAKVEAQAAEIAALKGVQ